MNQDKKTLPPLVNEPSKEKPNKLAKRLYKNNSMKKLNTTMQFSYLRNMNQDSSILGMSLSKNNSSKNLLIPSISLKRNKQIQKNQRSSMQITQGKVLLSKLEEPTFLHYKGDLKRQLKKTTSNSKLLFRKLNRQDGINQKQILPDQLLGSSSDNDGSYQGKIQRSNKSPSNKATQLLKGLKNKGNSQADEQNITPNDFIQLLQQDSTITNEFCYLKKMSHAYDLKIIQFKQNPTEASCQKQLCQQYITISSRGVSYFSKQNSRFVPLQRWKKQAYFFSRLMNLQFFSKYRLFKNFAKWKKYIRKTAMKSTTDKLKNQLLIGDRFLRKALMITRDKCYRMQTDINYCKFDDCQDVMLFHKFKTSQDLFIQNQFEKRIIDIQQSIKQALLIHMSQSMKEFKEENKISSSNQNKGIPLLIGDQKNLQMPYTKQATLRIHQQKFKKFLKLIQFVIVDSKIKMMNESTQNIIKKIYQQCENYQKQVIDSDYKLNYKGKQYIQCFSTINIQSQQLCIRPSQSDLQFMFQDIINKSLIKLCRNHKRIINDDEILEIIYDSNQKIVKEQETNILKTILMADDREEKIVNIVTHALAKAYNYICTYSNRFTNMLHLYFHNLRQLNDIDHFTAKDHQVIKQSLENWKDQLLQINVLSQQHESAIFLLNFRQFKEKSIKCVTQCLQKMKKVAPQIFKSTTDSLLQQFQESLKRIQTKPIGVQSFMQFQNSKNQIVNYLQDYSQKLAQINCIWIIMKNNASNNQMSTIARQQRQINRLQSILNTLRTKLQQAEMNTKIFQTRAQQQVKDMIPKVKENIYKQYLKIKLSKYDVGSNVIQVINSIQKDQNQYQSILKDIQNIKSYQKFLSMEQYNDDTINKFTHYFKNYVDIWNFRKNIHDYQQNILQQPWTQVQIQEAKKQVDVFFNKALKLKKKIASQTAQDDEFKIQPNDIDVLSFIFLQAKNLKPLIETVQCLRSKSLTQKQFRQIKSYFEKIQKAEICSIIDIQNKQATIKNILDYKINEQLDFLQSVVFKSKKQMEINQKMSMVNKFWIQNSTGNNAGKNLTENFQKTYWDIIYQIDQKITVINGINQDTAAQQDIRLNLTNNKLMFDSLRVLLTQWQIHQRYLHYFQPIFMNSYWKATKQMKIYASAQNNWKKLLKQCKDYSLKRWASNQKAISTLRQNILLFEQLKKAIQDFLTAKRQTFPKFYFLSNQQLLHILLEQKDFKSVQKHFYKIFTCLKSLDIKEDNNIPIGVENLSSEYLTLKFPRISNFQIEELFRCLQQSIKQAIRSNLRTCLSTYQKDEFNRKQWTKQNLLQVLLFIQRSQYTKIIQYDYLCPQPQDLSQYVIYQLSQIKQLHSYLKQQNPQPNLSLIKIQTLLLQQVQQREITQSLIKLKILDEQSFQWQRQVKCYYKGQSVLTKYMTSQVQYGNQFVSLENCFSFTILSQRESLQLSNAISLRVVPVINGRSRLIQNFCKINAKHYDQVLCQSNMTNKFLLNTLTAAYLTGTYIQFNNVQNLVKDQLSLMSNFMKEIYVALNRKQRIFPFGVKKNPLNVNAAVIFRLSNIQLTDTISANFTASWKLFQFNSISISGYLSMMMQVKKYQSGNLSKKISKTVQIINDLEGYEIISFDEIKGMFNNKKINLIQNLQSYFSKQISEIVLKKIINSKKTNFYKKLISQIILQQKDAQEILYNESVTTKSLKQKSDFKFIVNTLVQITDKKSLCIVSGPTQCGKIATITQAYRQRICRNFQLEVLNMDAIDQAALFGCYINGLWKEGILITKIKQLQFFKQEWTVFQGSYNSQMKKLIQRLTQPYLQLSNGQIVSLSLQWKFIFSVYDLNENINEIPYGVEIIKSTKFISIQETLYMMLQKRIKPHFENLSIDNFNQLSNMSLNNFEKVMGLLKIIGFKNQFTKAENIIRYFINIMDCLLFEIPPNMIQSKDFSKGIQKIFVWSIYWSLGSGIPQVNANKFQKSLFQIIRTDIQRSQNISHLKLDFENAFGNFKKIKLDDVSQIKNNLYFQTLDLKSKAHFTQLTIKKNYPVILIGKTGSGKTQFMRYLQNTLNPQKYTFLHVKLRKGIQLQEFKDILMRKTRVSIKNVKKKCFCSSTNKKLVIMIDDFNLLQQKSQVKELMTSYIRNGYYYDFISNEKIFMDNISFVVTENQTYEFRLDNRLLKYFKPIYINHVDLKEIAEIYKKLYLSLRQQSSDSFYACVSLNNFVLNLQSTKQFICQQRVSQNIAIRIMKCLIEYNGKQNIAKVWAYLGKKEYSSLFTTVQCHAKIQKQISNLLNLMIKDTAQKPQPVDSIHKLIQQLKEKFFLVKADCSLQDYYQYLAFLLQLDSSHNILSIQQCLPEKIKADVLKHVALYYQHDFFFCRNVSDLKSLDHRQKAMIYISFQDLEEVYRMLGFISNSNQIQAYNIIIDCPSRNIFKKLLQQYPSLTSKFHIFSKQNKSNLNILSDGYLKMFQKIQQLTKKKLSQKQYFQIVSSLLKNQEYINKQYDKQLVHANKFVNRYQKMRNDIQKNEKNIQQLINQLKSYNIQEEQTFNKKKQVNQKIIKLKNNKIQDQDEDEDEDTKIQALKKMQDQVNQSDIQLKSLKSKKNQTSDKVSKIQSILTLQVQVLKKVQQHNDLFKTKIQNLSKLQTKKQKIIFLLNLYLYGINNSNQLLKSFVSNYSKIQSIDLNYVIKLIFNVDLHISNQNIFKWIMNHKKVVILDYHQIFIHHIQKSVQNIKIYTDINHLISDSENHQSKLFIGKFDQKALNIQNCSVIINEQISSNKLQDSVVIKVEQSKSSKNEKLRQILYNYLQPNLNAQMINLQQQINRLQIQNQQQYNHIIQLFEKQIQSSGKNLNDIKKQCNIYNSTKQRLKPIYKSLLSYQNQLKNKHQAFIYTCLVISQFLSFISQKINYFSLSIQQLQSLIKISASGIKPTLKTRKTLIQKSQHNVKNLSQSDVMTQKINIQTQKINIQTQKIDVQTQKINVQTQKINVETQKINIQQNQDNKLQVKVNLKTQKSIKIQDVQKSITNEERSDQNIIYALIQLVISKIILYMNCQDSKIAYLIFSFYINEVKFNFSSVYRNLIIKISYLKQQISKEQIIDIQNNLAQQINILCQKKRQKQSKIKNIGQKLLQIIHSLKENDNKLIQKLVQYADYTLNLNFICLLDQKYQNEDLALKNDIIIISNKNQNPYQIIQTKIFNKVQNPSWTYIFEQDFQPQKLLFSNDKNPIGWYIIINPKRKTLFNQLIKRQKSIQLSFIYLFTSQEQKQQLKINLGCDVHYLNNIDSVYVQSNGSIKNIIKNMYVQNLYKLSINKPQIQKLCRIIFYDEVNQLLKDQQQHNVKQFFLNYFYHTREISFIVNQLKPIHLKNFAQIYQEFCYSNRKQRQKLILKQAKKILAKHNQIELVLLQTMNLDWISIQQSSFQGISFINENVQTLMQMLSNASVQIQYIINTFLPNSIKKLYPSEILQKQPLKTIQQKEENNLQNHELSLNQINEITLKIQQLLNNFPTITALGLDSQQNTKKQKYIYKTILKDQIKNKLNAIATIQFILKNCKKLVQNDKILSLSTESQLFSFILQAKLPKLLFKQTKDISVQNYLLKLQKNIQYLQKLYSSKQSQKVLQVQHLSNACQFLKFYLYQMNPQASFLTTQISSKCHNQKDKQSHFQISQPCKGLTIPQVLIKNGKYDLNKNIIQSNEKNQSNKIMNVHVCFVEKEGTNFVNLPLIYKQHQIINFVTQTKLKEQNIWKQKLQLNIATSDSV